ncbi:MAG: oxidoreductase [Polyangiales bacterium]
MTEPWNLSRVPDLSGKTVIVTGANSGIGLEAALVFATHRADVILGCRSREKAAAAVARIEEHVPDANLMVIPLDLADLASIEAFATRVHSERESVDVLVNNAGVMALPRQRTKDGFEMQFGTNHLGHFALTAHLLDSLLAVPGGRIVNVSSFMHKYGRIRLDDPNADDRYNKWVAYASSKLANLLFTHELDRRLKTAGKGAISVACHPGWASTNLAVEGPRLSGSQVMGSLASWANSTFAQSAAEGALPTVYASTEPLVGGEFIGPDGFRTWRGRPALQVPSPKARDAGLARQLWDTSEQLTGIQYQLG